MIVITPNATSINVAKPHAIFASFVVPEEIKRIPPIKHTMDPMIDNTWAIICLGGVFVSETISTLQLKFLKIWIRLLVELTFI